jgi:MFS superfamily sulfate permease-like transporter
MLALSFLTPYFYFIPKPVLSAVLISAVVFLIDWKIVQRLWHGNSKYEGHFLLLVFHILSINFFNIEY